MTLRLDALFAGMDVRIDGDPGLAITDLCYDSRRARAGALFVALSGASVDGHDFIPQAQAAGARALLVERPPERRAADTTLVLCADPRAALPRIAARFFAEPAAEMTLVGVTGTNGKTSTVRLIESILLAAGRNAGSIGTISTRFAGRESPSLLTTPESVDLQRTLRDMRDAGVDCAAMEVSSHSLVLGRTAGLRFRAAVFTNLSQDHLDFHGDMETYAAAKTELFGPGYLDGTGVINAADPREEALATRALEGGNAVLRYARASLAPRADVRASEIALDLGGARFALDTPLGRAEVRLELPGEFQIDNALAAAAAALALDVSLDDVAAGLERCPGIPGRFERVSPEFPAVLVDYAHTPDALDRVLAHARPLVRGRLICVFGCGGDRDRAKRAPMARAVCKHCDLAIATSDNPRSEDPAAILDDVAAGLSGDFVVIPDRAEAIAHAITSASEEDVVVIAGKGHEDYQIVGDRRLPFDDRTEARRALAARGSRS